MLYIIQGVFTYLIENLGVKGVQFEELISLDADLLRQHRYSIVWRSTRARAWFIGLADGKTEKCPILYSPVYGVIFLFKYPTGQKSSDGPQSGTFDADAAERLFFARQTIQNACGTQALLSVLLNQDDGLDVGPQLKDFKAFADGLPSDVSYSSSKQRLDEADGEGGGTNSTDTRGSTVEFGAHQGRP